MSSQLNVDTIVDKAGSGGTNVKIANTSVTVGEGGSGTTNTVQGLTKAWVQSDSDATLDEGDSFNVSGSTDHSSGKYSYDLINGMAGIANYSQSGCCRGSVDGRIMTRDTGTDRSNRIGVETSDDAALLTDIPHDVQIVGDLA
jgi:hypothetical protein